MKSFSKLCDTCKTVSDLYYELSKFLSLNLVDAPQITSEYLVMSVLGFETKTDLYVNFSKKISASQLETAIAYAQRRAIEREPLEYITGNAYFCGLKFKSDKRALIPRCDTEVIITSFSQIKKGQNIKKVLDLCTGSGIIGITLKKMYPDIEIYMSDISIDAICLAKENCKQQSLDKIYLINCDGLSSFKESSFDVIVSNPPYIEETIIDSLEPEVVKWEPKIALTGGADGLDFHRKYFSNILSALSPCGIFLCETGGNTQTAPLKNMYEKMTKRVSFHKDINRNDRVMKVEK